MAVEVRQESPASLAAYASIPVAFEVRSRLRAEGAEGRVRLIEVPVDPPYPKDYDALDGSPLDWAARWDVSAWGIFLARDAGQVVGGAAVGCRTPGPYDLERRDDLAALADLRVKPDRRRAGVGRELFDACAAWARRRRCRTLKVETQDVNVPACRFYAARGCRLGAVRPGAYPSLPDEVCLLWYLNLAADQPDVPRW